MFYDSFAFPIQTFMRIKTLKQILVLFEQAKLLNYTWKYWFIKVEIFLEIQAFQIKN